MWNTAGVCEPLRAAIAASGEAAAAAPTFHVPHPDSDEPPAAPSHEAAGLGEDVTMRDVDDAAGVDPGAPTETEAAAAAGTVGWGVLEGAEAGAAGAAPVQGLLREGGGSSGWFPRQAWAQAQERLAAVVHSLLPGEEEQLVPRLGAHALQSCGPSAGCR